MAIGTAHRAGRRGRFPTVCRTEVRVSIMVHDVLGMDNGAAKTREVKLISVWAATDARGHELPEREPSSVSYSTAVESAAAGDAEPSPFVRRAGREARRRGFGPPRRRVVLGDGAQWIWNIADELFSGAVQIVDLLHATQHLWDVAKAIYGPAPTSPSAGRGGAPRNSTTAGSRAAAHAAPPRRQRPGAPLRDYIRRSHRMRYPACRAMGLYVRSGVVESGCKHVVGTRFKRPSMQWSVAGINAMITLRRAVLGNRFDDFWRRRKGGPA